MSSSAGTPGLIAHEWVESTGGAERVVDSFARVYPDADLYSLWIDDQERYEHLSTFESRLARGPLRNHKAAALPLMSRYWRASDLTEYDWALISSYAFAHHLGSGPKQRHLRRFVYVHSPARYLWAPSIDPRGQHPVAKAIAPLLRWQDRGHVSTGHFAANSHFVQRRIRRAWEVDSEVIYPPVEVADLQSVPVWRHELDEEERAVLDTLPDEYVLGASRFVSYKGLDRVLKFAQVTGTPVVIAGRGPDEERLRTTAAQLGVEAYFVISPSDALMRTLMQEAQAFIYPPVEDFGIMVAEAIALKTPVVVNRVGGACEIIGEVGGGVCVDFSDGDEWVRAMSDARQVCMETASSECTKFSAGSFENRVREWTASAA